MKSVSSSTYKNSLEVFKRAEIRNSSFGEHPRQCCVYQHNYKKPRIFEYLKQKINKRNNKYLNSYSDFMANCLIKLLITAYLKIVRHIHVLAVKLQRTIENTHFILLTDMFCIPKTSPSLFGVLACQEDVQKSPTKNDPSTVAPMLVD